MKKANEQKGITLVALVITIVILLILATISIQSLTNTGLFAKAQEAKEKTKNATENQAKTLNEYEDELNKYVSGTTQTQKLADKVKVGDYVEYTPDELGNESLTTLKTNLNTYSGNSNSTVNPAIKRDDLKWRVLDIQNGQVRLISETPTTSKIELYGYNGYNNAVKLIDDACSTLYTNKQLASTVQNLKIEDITKYMKIQPTEDSTQYLPTNIKYPKILETEENQTVEKTNSTSTKLGVSSQESFVTGNDISSTTTLKKTYWFRSMNNTDSFIDNKYYELFTNNGKDYPTYWISSRCVVANSDYADFDVRAAGPGNVGACYLYRSGIDNSFDFAFRPCITLNSNVQVTSGNGSSSSPFGIK